MRALIEQLVALWRGLLRRLDQINDSDEVAKFGEGARKIRRLEAVSAWRDEALARIEAFRKTEWPQLVSRYHEDVTAAVMNLSRGQPPGTTLRPAPPAEAVQYGESVSEGLNKLNTQTAARDAGFFGLLLQQLRLQNTLTLSGLQSTQQLTARVKAYAADALAGETFDYSGWALDRIVLPALLEARSLEGDGHATFSLDECAQIEQTLIQRGVGPSPVSDNDEYLLTTAEQAARGVIQGQGESARENLEPASQRFGMLARALERAPEPAGPPPAPKPPLPRPDYGQLELRRLAGLPVPPIARLWGGQK